jgi:CRP/FNR family transcriptional regulator
LFAHFDDEQLRRFAALAQPQHLQAGSCLFLQGDRASAFYLLAEGELKVFKTLRDGRDASLRHVPAGQTLAEAALFRETYPSSAETMTDCLIYRFDRQRTLDLLAAEPQLSLNLLAAMADLLGLLNRRVEELLLPVAARLARYLLARADEQSDPPGAAAPRAGTAGSPPADGPRVVTLPTTKRELAARLGTVPETLSRTFDRLRRAEVVRMSADHRLIEILSFDKLHQIAQD